MPTFHVPPLANLVVGGWLIVVALVIVLVFAPGGDE